MAVWSSPETAERVLAHIAEKADEHREVAATARGVGIELDMDATTVNRAFARLVGTGALDVVRRGTSVPTVYRVCRAADPRIARRYAPTSAA